MLYSVHVAPGGLQRGSAAAPLGPLSSDGPSLNERPHLLQRLRVLYFSEAVALLTTRQG